MSILLMNPSETHTRDGNLYLRVLWWIRVRWGCRWQNGVCGGVGTGVNIASGLGRAPVPFRPHRKTSLLKRLDRELMTSVDYAA